MYQKDMSGNNAITNAFSKNSIFSLNAFIDGLLEIEKEDSSKNLNQFENCFDGALLLMIRKSLDVGDLCSSSLFYK